MVKPPQRRTARSKREVKREAKNELSKSGDVSPIASQLPAEVPIMNNLQQQTNYFNQLMKSLATTQALQQDTKKLY